MPPFVPVASAAATDVRTWWFVARNRLQGSRVIPPLAATARPRSWHSSRATPAKVEPWRCIVVEIVGRAHRRDHGLFFSSTLTSALIPLFGFPSRLD